METVARTFYIKQNDQLPILEGYAVKKDGSGPVNCASVTVRFIMRPTGVAAPVVNATAQATVINASLGLLGFCWASGMTATNGLFQSEFELIHPDGRPQTVPNRGYQPVQVGDDVA